jgi:hypothetical protein
MNWDYSGRLQKAQMDISQLPADLVWAISTLITTPFMGSESRLGTIGAFRDFRAGSREYAA